MGEQKVKMTQRMKIAHATRIACLATMLVSLASCGGGGGGGGGEGGGGSLALFAGNMGGEVNVDGARAAAGLNFPQGVATESTGNIYVGDRGNHTIRKITPAGAVSTFAGTPGIFGSADGTGAAARFNLPEGVATDSADNVYVADEGNNTIRKITPAGVVTTLAGRAGFSGGDDGIGAAARFDFPRGVATDSAGNYYVADHGNHPTRTTPPAGVVTTLAGTAGVVGGADGAGAAASFNFPGGVATDSASNVYVADGNHTIRKITSLGVVSTLAGTTGVIGSTDAAGAAASFDSPVGVATDSAGNVYVTDTSNNTIRKITPAGAVTTLAGTAGVSGSSDGTGPAARFNLPRGVAADGAGNVYVADSSNHTIRKITPAGVVTTLAGTASVSGGSDGAGAAASFNFPTGIATDSAGNIYVADTDNSTIRKITPAGVVTTVAGAARQADFAPGPLPGLIAFPLGAAASGTSLSITLNNGVAALQNPPCEDFYT